jgi:large subunit ribosomal protein L21
LNTRRQQKLYTVIKTGGKQFKVDTGDIIKVDMIPGEVGAKVTFNDILALGEGEDIKVGTPYVEGAEVVGKILRQAKDKKIIVFKKKRRKGYSRKAGHRQQFTEILIEEIKSQKKAAKKAPETEDKKVKKDAAETKTISKEEKKPKKKEVQKASKAENVSPPQKLGIPDVSTKEKESDVKDTK